MKGLKRYFTAGVLLLYLLLVIVGPVSGQGGIPGPGMPGPGYERESHATSSSYRLTIEKIFTAVQDGKTQRPTVYKDLKTLLYIEALKPKNYIPPSVWVYDDNKYRNVSREDPINIRAFVRNDNTLEARRTIILTLEVKEPGEKDFKPFSAEPQKIFMKEYSEQYNTSKRTFPELTSFRYLKKVGNVAIRVKAEDGLAEYYSSNSNYAEYKGYYRRPELVFNVNNVPPQINNSSMIVSPNPSAFDSLIEFKGSFNDSQNYSSLGSDLGSVEVTLHLLQGDQEVNNITKKVLPSDGFLFNTKDKNLFNKTDSGKNFSYYYTLNDGILGGKNTTATEVKNDGVGIKPNPEITVEEFFSRLEGTNESYWWQGYSFGLKAKSQNPGGSKVKVDLYAGTSIEDMHHISDKEVELSSTNYTDISFEEVHPFDVDDRDKVYQYYFTYDQPDENGDKRSPLMYGVRIDNKLLQYRIYSWEMLLGNIFPILLLTLLGGFIVERMFIRRR